MQNKKKITIVIPTYNMEKYIGRCLDSLLIKDVNSFEQLQVIVVNDGSKDNSLRVAKVYEDKYPTVIEVIDKENGNYGSCVNKGLELAKGVYFRILDADDWVDTNQLEKLIKEIDITSKVDILFTNYALCRGNSKKEICAKRIVYSHVYNVSEFDFTKNREILRMHSMTFRTELLRQCGLSLQTGISYTDAEYCFYPYVKANTMQFLDINLYQYFFGREGQTVSKSSVIKNFKDFYLVAKRMLGYYLKTDCISVLSHKQNKSLVDFISNSLYNIYAIMLVYKKNPTEFENKEFLEICELVNQNRLLNSKVCRFTYHKIPFVWLWKKTKVRLSNLI